MTAQPVESSEPARTRRLGDGAIAALVVGIAGAFFAATALPGFHWHDTAEFGAVGWRLSLSHPPGHPVHALLTRAAQALVPVGDLAFRANLLSGLLVAAALGGAWWVLRALAPAAPRWATAAAAMLPAVMPAVWLQAVRAEVYALQLLLTVAIAGLALRVARGDGRALPALALVFGLAGANHSLIGLYWIPVALLAIAVGVRRWRPVAWAAPAGLLGLSAYLYLPLRAGAGGVVGWGRPDSPAAMWHMISARDWLPALSSGGQTTLGDDAATLAAYGIEQTGPIAALLLLCALLAGLLPLVRARRATAAVAALAVLIAAASPVIHPLDPANPDLGGYLAGALLAGVALVLMAVDALPARARLWAAAAFPAALLLAAPGFDPGDRRGSRSAERVARARLAEVPPDGVLVSSDYATAFQTWSLRALQGARPDVAPVFRGRVEADWHRRRLAEAHPAVAAALPVFPRGFDGPAVRFEPGVEMHRLGPLGARLRPVGLTLAVGQGWPSIAALAEALGPLGDVSDRDAHRQAAFALAQHAAHALRAGAPAPLVGWLLDRAEALAPGDALLAELRHAAAGGTNLLDRTRSR